MLVVYEHGFQEKVSALLFPSLCSLLCAKDLRLVKSLLMERCVTQSAVHAQ